MQKKSRALVLTANPKVCEIFTINLHGLFYFPRFMCKSKNPDRLSKIRDKLVKNHGVGQQQERGIRVWQPFRFNEHTTILLENTMTETDLHSILVVFW